MNAKKRNYHKESGYAAQRKYAATHFANISFVVYKTQKEELSVLASNRGISLTQLIKDALEAQYGIHLSKPERTATQNEIGTNNSIHSENEID